jgi:phosphoadenylyl-sulfate reductase (thioredoxin)
MADTGAAAHQLETADAVEVLRWASRRIPRLTFATGFGAEGCVIVDLIARHQLPIDLFTLDTGVLFRETYELWKQLEAKYGVTIRAVAPAQTIPEQALVHGAALWEREPDRCCELRKVIPLRHELAKFDGWITAIRRDQTPERANARVVEDDRKFGLIKVNPLVAWTHDDVWAHIYANDVPYNALHDRGFPSIGCEPCTVAVAPGDDPRSGRWRGKAKRECGLHVVTEGKPDAA